MTSMPWVTARRVRSLMPASVSASRTSPSGCSVRSRVRPPVWPTSGFEIGCASSCSFGITLARAAASAMRTWTPRWRMPMPPSARTLSRWSTPRTSSRKALAWEATSSVWSTSSSSCEPPWRSRPRTIARLGTIQAGNQPGSAAMKPLRWSAEKKLGTARLRPIRMATRVAMILVRGKAQHPPTLFSAVLPGTCPGILIRRVWIRSRSRGCRERLRAGAVANACRGERLPCRARPTPKRRPLRR